MGQPESWSSLYEYGTLYLIYGLFSWRTIFLSYCCGRCGVFYPNKEKDIKILVGDALCHILFSMDNNAHT